MSRLEIARVLGKLDYGDHEDEVDLDDRLREAEGLIASGVVVDVDDLLLDVQVQTWHQLAAVLVPMGWKPMVIYGGDLYVAWVLPHTSRQQIDDRRSPQVCVDWGRGREGWVTWTRALLDEDDEDTDLSPAFTTAQGWLDWMSTP